jgi:hypothetical protein
LLLLLLLRLLRLLWAGPAVARWGERYAELGWVDDDATGGQLSALIEGCCGAEGFMAGVESFRCAVDEAAFSFGAFLRWLSTVAARLPSAAGADGENGQSARQHHTISAVDSQRVARFLRRGVGPSRLLQSLRPTPALPDAAAEELPAAEGGGGGGGGSSSSSSSSSSTVLEQLEWLAARAEEAFARPVAAISASFFSPGTARVALPPQPWSPPFNIAAPQLVQRRMKPPSPSAVGKGGGGGSYGRYFLFCEEVALWIVREGRQVDPSAAPSSSSSSSPPSAYSYEALRVTLLPEERLVDFDFYCGRGGDEEMVAALVAGGNGQGGGAIGSAAKTPEQEAPQADLCLLSVRSRSHTALPSPSTACGCIYHHRRFGAAHESCALTLALALTACAGLYHGRCSTRRCPSHHFRRILRGSTAKHWPMPRST